MDQAPEDWRSFRGQQYRWRRGLIQVLWRHREMIFNPRYGVVGVRALPHFVVFEGVAPLLEIRGDVVIALGGMARPAELALHTPDRRLAGVFGTGVALSAVLLENCGYRQLNSWWSCVATARALGSAPRGGDEAACVRSVIVGRSVHGPGTRVAHRLTRFRCAFRFPSE
jgi:hypothetical protein